MDTIKTRFAPSPTGWLHVGGARTALFNYLLARQAGGTFLLRIEDTDLARHDESAVAKIIDDLVWLGIEWDEGVEVGGDNGPYRQSERLGIYTEHIGRLLDSGRAYYAFETPEELDAMRADARAEKRNFRYPRPGPLPTAADADKARAAGRPVVVRFKIPARDVTIHDEVFGEVTVAAGEQDDFIIQKTAPDGQAAWPTYHLANVVDDAMMGVNFVCRGQEFLSQTWRHVLLREAFGFTEPKYAHLPLIMDMKGRKLSKRDGAVEVHAFRTAGYLPEVLVNFIALLGWSPGGNIEQLTMDDLVDAFSVNRINKANAKFDRQKLLAFNTVAVAPRRGFAPEVELWEKFKEFLDLNETAIPKDNPRMLKRLIGANPGFRTFKDILDKCNVLFVADDAFEYDKKAVDRFLARGNGVGYSVLAELMPGLAKLTESPDPADNKWKSQEFHSLFEEIFAKRAVGMGKVAQPIRVAVTGTTISPEIYNTLAILGKDKTLARIDRCLAMRE
ncbi:MAG: glutamate--tRNA ligase [Planctomycetota bacterium]|nr:glutamate--tRNA ligase [Planctomycetota bacterium]